MKQTMSMIYNIAVCGDKGCGKSAFMRKHTTGEFLDESIPLTEAELQFNTTKGPVVLFLSEGKNYSKNFSADATIFMMDLSKPQNEKKIEIIMGNCIKPKTLCGNKVDLNRAQTPTSFVLSMIKTQGISYHDISAKGGYNLEKPLRDLMRLLTNQPDLEIECALRRPKYALLNAF